MSDEAPLIVDSWLLEDGLALGLDLHEQRFRRSCEELLPSIENEALDKFFGSVRAMLPREGRWFPRVEGYAEPSSGLALRLRRAPSYPGPISLWVPPNPDPREHPAVKGPDLETLAGLREQARSAGADDALLYADGGAVLETAHSALVWWRGQTLCLPAEDLPVLPSITTTFVMSLAEGLGMDVSREHCSLDELFALPAWSVNALHGIRPVSSWIGAGGAKHAVTGDPQFAEWLALLDGHKLPIGPALNEPAGETAR